MPFRVDLMALVQHKCTKITLPRSIGATLASSDTNAEIESTAIVWQIDTVIFG